MYTTRKLPYKARKLETVKRYHQKTIDEIEKLVDKLEKLKNELLVAEARSNGWSLFKVIETWENHHNGNSEETVYYTFATTEDSAIQKVIQCIRSERDIYISSVDFRAEKVSWFDKPSGGWDTI